MADAFVQLAADSTGKKVDTGEITVGANTVERQRIVNADDTVAAALARVLNAQPASTDYGLVVRQAGDGLAWHNAASVTASGVVGAVQDCTGYNWVELELRGTFTATLQFQYSNDNTNWTNGYAWSVSTALPSGSPTTSFTTPGIWWAPVKARYMRVNCTSFTSNTSSALTTYLKVGTPPADMINVNIPGIPSVQGTAGASTSAIRITPDATSAAANFSSARIVSAASTNATFAKSGAGNLYSLFLQNTTATVVFFKLYDKNAAPTVGTDTPKWTIPVPPNNALIAINLDMNPLRFALGIGYAITNLLADTDTTAVTAGAVHGQINFA